MTADKLGTFEFFADLGDAIVSPKSGRYGPLAFFADVGEELVTGKWQGRTLKSAAVLTGVLSFVVFSQPLVHWLEKLLLASPGK